ncbi:MAG: site-2 protease family protein [Candidatus Margulisbacteria bacterium]|nr:site-2 protease family protein [Candidatus Margulisiibacteriota bacterium]
MKNTFKLTTLFNIPIDINYTWFVIVGLVIFTLANGYFPLAAPELGPLAWWLMAVISAFLLFASLLAHELAHSLIAIRNNLPIHGITLFIFGGVAHMNREPQSPKVELKMAIAGPIMSFALAIIFYLITNLLTLFHFSTVFFSITTYLFIINFMVGTFNLIPGFPLDGGRVLRAVLWHFCKDIRQATSVASTIGKGFAFFLMAVGFLKLIGGAILSGIWLLFLGLFLAEAADVSYKQVVMRKTLGGITVEKCMTKKVIIVSPQVTLDALVDHFFLKLRHASFPVMEDDMILGIVTLHDVKSVPKENWLLTTAKDIMLPIGEGFIVSKDMDVINALAKMASNKIHRLMVVDEGKLIGFISQRDIVKLFEMKSEIG